MILLKRLVERIFSRITVEIFSTPLAMDIPRRHQLFDSNGELNPEFSSQYLPPSSLYSHM